jgi:hypothetical protein
LLAVNHHVSPYSERYPQLRELDAYLAKDAGVPPEGNVVARNVCVGPWMTVGWHAQESMLRVADNLVGEDPGFVDRAAGNFQLRDDSPAYRRGFKRIPFDAIGLRVDEYRARR